MEIREELLIHDSRDYVLWRRVSTKTQGKSGLGLDAQLSMARIFTKKEPVQIFTDVYTGTKLRECRALWEAIDFCKANGYLLVIAKTDRFRNVKEALEVIDSIGERNISFCDLPNVDRMILTIMFAVWERQAYMGRINTKLALDERRKQCELNGGWMSKAGNWCTAVGGAGRPPDTNKRLALIAAKEASEARMAKTAEWAKTSMGFNWVVKQVKKGVPRKDIIEEFNYYHNNGMEGFSTVTGKPLDRCILFKWIDIGKRYGYFDRNENVGGRV